MRLHKIFHLLTGLLLILFLSNCTAYHIGYLNNSATLNQPNFIYASQNVKGQAKATYFLGIGGMEKETLVAKAKENLMENHQLEDNQVLANTTVNFKQSHTFFLLLVTYECTITADIVEFQPKEKSQKGG
ncbi:MAG: DUF6567 family protein [Bacteroidales bacterium]